MSEHTPSTITLPWATQEDVDDFFTPPTKPVKPLFVASYLLAQLFFFIALLGPAIVAIQVKVMAMFPNNNPAQVDAVATIAGLGALGALFANVIFGQISDRTTWAWGRRRPWLVIGIVTMAVGLAMMGLFNTVPLVAAGWLIGQIGANATLAPFVAVISDQISETQRARVSSWISIAQNLAVLIATYLAQGLATRLPLLFIGPAIPAILFMTWFAFVLPDKRMPVKPPRFGFVEMLKTFWVNPIAHPDYALAWWGRFLITFASFSFTLMTASFVGGWLSDMFHRRKVFVMLASVLFGIGTALLAHTTTVGMFYCVEAIMGLAYGIYVAVDLALVVDVLPNPDNAGKDLGVFNIANALPQSLAPYIAPFFLAIGSINKTNYPALCYMAGVCAIIGGLLVIPIKKVK